MPRRSILFLALFCLPLLASPPARAADARTGPPTLVVRLESVDDLFADLKYLAAFADRDDLVAQAEGILKARGGAKGIEGIDTKRPLGLYGLVSEDVISSKVVALVPLADEKAFLNLLKSLNLKPEEGKDGVYTVKVDPVPFPIFFRFANQYVYATIRDESAIAKDALLPLAKVLPPGEVGMMSASVRLDHFSTDLKQLAMGQLGLRLADIRDRDFSGGNKAEKEFWKQAFEEFSSRIKSVLKDGEELGVHLSVDRKKNDLSLELTLNGKEDSKLAGGIAELGQGKSLFGALFTENAALRGELTVALPESLRKAFAAVIDENVAQGLEKEKDAAKRKAGADFIKGLEPSLKAGEFDGCVVLMAPSGAGKYHTTIVGVKLKDGAALEKAARELVQVLPPDAQGLIHLDAETTGGVKVHRLDAQKQYDEKAKKLYGDNPAYVAIRDDVLFFTLGENALGTLKEALATKPATAPLLELELSLSRLASAIAIDRKDDKGIVERAAKEAFDKDKDGDTIRFRVEGGKALKLRVQGKAPVIKFLDELQKAEQK
jgi:hypothetical protein